MTSKKFSTLTVVSNRFTSTKPMTICIQNQDRGVNKGYYVRQGLHINETIFTLYQCYDQSTFGWLKITFRTEPL